MTEKNKTEEFLQKLTPCIERGELEKCVEEAARLAGEMGIGAEELLDLSMQEGMGGKHDFTYVLALAAARGLEVEGKAIAYYNAGLAAQYLRKVEKAEEHYKLAIEADPKLAAAHYNYANLLSEQKRNDEAEQHYKLAIEADPKYAAAHYNYANLLSEQKRNDEAEQHYKLAIEADPKYAAAHSNYAILLKEQKRN
ncbi:MAG: tetratricopeptide repeat protein, partial [Candidatus Methanoperedens sp.]|nr:tetratricopeptide repeat protein [Candidatus Methanoperedens sp.]